LVKAYLDHIAITVKSIESIIPKLSELDISANSINEFPSEGTREMYAGESGLGSRLLFMEAIEDGPYRNSVKKRGFGLHHIAINISQLENYVEGLSGSGWYLHPKSLKTFKECKTIWLSRPGYPVLIEVHSPTDFTIPDKYLVSQVNLPICKEKPQLIKSLNIGGKLVVDSNSCYIRIGDLITNFKDFCG